MSNKKPLRIVLEGREKEAVENMVRELNEEGEFVKISPSRLVAWIVRRFEGRDFKRQKEGISKEHFNSKKYLEKLALKTGEDENLETVLRRTLKEIGNSGGKVGKKSGAEAKT